MRRFTILSLMGLVLALAVGLAALRRANEYWAGGLMLATPLVLLVALIGGICGKERSRAGRLGFAVLGGGYFALAFLGLAEPNLARLPTSKLFSLVHEKVAPPQNFVYMLTGTVSSAMGGMTTPGSPTALTVTKTPQTVNITSTPSGGSTVTSVFNEAVTGETQPPNRWRAMLPGAAELASFSAVGHCLFALLAGLLGAAIARRFERGGSAASAARGSGDGGGTLRSQ